MEDGLSLTTVTRLLAVVTTLSLSESRSLAGLVLGDLVKGVLAALPRLAESLTGLGDVDHFGGWTVVNGVLVVVWYRCPAISSLGVFSTKLQFRPGQLCECGCTVEI